tara:strand:- start:640 stop:3006 length:2367 start_codon:yes stop_codon:yes gene_type:complete
MSQKTLSGSQYGNRTMNGIISIDDGQGTVIENGQIQTDTMNATTISADNLLEANQNETITGAWNFQTLPYSLLQPFGNFEFANKEYVDTAIIGADYVDLTTNQTITSGVKTFIDTPVCANVPLINADLVNKLYLDNYITTATTQNITGKKDFQEGRTLFNGLTIDSGDDLTSNTYGLFNTNYPPTNAAAYSLFQNELGETSFNGSNLTNISCNDGQGIMLAKNNATAGSNGGATYPMVIETDTGDINFNNLPTCSVAPTANDNLANKAYVDNHLIGTFVDLTTNQTITSGIKIFTDTPTCANVPNTSQSLTNKLYVDTSVSNLVTKATSQIISATKTFTAIPQTSIVPVSDVDLANKKYVDDEISGAGGNFVTTNTTQDVSGKKNFKNIIETEPITHIASNQIVFIDKPVATTRTFSGINSISIGENCLQTGDAYRQIAIGANALFDAGISTQANPRTDIIAIGRKAVEYGGGIESIGIGLSAMSNTTGAAEYNVAIGTSTCRTSVADHVIGIGWRSAEITPASQSVHIGAMSGQTFAGTQTCSLGVYANEQNSGAAAIAIGHQANRYTAGSVSVACGFLSGNNTGYGSVAVGGWSNRNATAGAGAYSVNLGFYSAAGGSNIGDVNIGYNAAAYAVSNGKTAERAINIGWLAGHNGDSATGDDVVCIGTLAGYNGGMRHSTIAIGRDAGYGNLFGNGTPCGHRSIAIGTRCLANGTNTADGSVCVGSYIGQSVGGAGSNVIALNGMCNGTILEIPNSSAFYVKPIRAKGAESGFTPLYYNTTTGEICW